MAKKEDVAFVCYLVVIFIMLVSEWIGWGFLFKNIHGLVSADDSKYKTELVHKKLVN